jgi:hypothetical protein
VTQLLNFKNLYFYFFLALFLIAGSYLSLNTGITHDEFHEHYVSEANKNIFLNKLFNKNYDTSYLIGGNKFYGSGFHYFSSILELAADKFTFLDQFSNEIKILLIKHVSVFFLFVISGLILKKIIKLITNNAHVSKLSAILYLLYPYLLGHSFFNVKDIPFLTIWLICTYFIIKISKKYFEKKIILIKDVIFISLFTAYLISIRISGVLIFIEYFIFILTLTVFLKINLLDFIKKFYKEFLISFLIMFLSFIILQPSYWKNPLLLIDGIKFMSQHLQTVCTITLGECMKAQNLPASYLPLWFFFKLPIFIIFGLFMFFFIEKKIKKQKLNSIILGSLSFSILSIILLLILFNVNLYDEIRQVMFLLPLIFIISLSIIQIYSKKIFYFFSIFFICFFIFQNFKIYPYNYIWINNFSHITKVQDIFELDYWGVSTRNVAKFFNKKEIDQNTCIITNRNNGVQPFIDKKNCFLNFKDLHKSNIRPFYVALMERGLKKGTPNNCEIVHEEIRSINFSREKISLAKIFKCN